MQKKLTCQINYLSPTTLKRSEKNSMASKDRTLNENTNIQLVTSGNTMKEKQLEPMKEDSENNGWGVEGCCTQLQVQ